MESVRYLVVGAGVSGLSFAHWVEGDDYLICEADDGPGGYCKTIEQDGFVWDYSGHFFHFKHPELEELLVSRMGDQKVLKVVKDSRILWKGELIDFPFQKNIHQLPKDDFIDCLYDLYFREDREATNFRDMLYAKFGKSIAEMFLVPYNEKLYATDLAKLDVDAMGRFFPYADVDQIVRNFRRADNRSYNATFTYPEGGAIQYVRALMQGVDESRISYRERVESIDLDAKIARTTEREIRFEHLISSAPFVRLLEMAGHRWEPEIYDWNKVLVFNLGFDRKGPEGIHWIYVPQRELSFYRVGFYDNIFGTDRMSMYVEIGRPRDAVIDDAEVERRPPAAVPPLGGPRPRLRPHHQALPRGGGPPEGRARRARCPQHRPLRLVDLLQHRGQHGRGPGPGRAAVGLRTTVPGSRWSPARSGCACTHMRTRDHWGIGWHRS